MKQVEINETQKLLLALTGWQAYIPSLWLLTIRKLNKISLSQDDDPKIEPLKFTEFIKSINLAANETVYFQALQQSRSIEYYLLLWGPSLAGFILGLITHFWLLFLAAGLWLLFYQSRVYLNAIEPQRAAAKHALALGSEIGLFEAGPQGAQ